MNDTGKEIETYQYQPTQMVGSGLRGLAEMMRDKIADMLPRHVTPARVIKALFVAASKTPKLLDCTQESVCRSIMTAAELGLDCSGTLGSGYLVPFNKECQFIPGYRGLIDLARRSGEIEGIEAHIVYKQDTFDVQYGTEPRLIHKPHLGSDRKDEYLCVYAIGTLKGGEKQIEVMTMADIEKIRGISKMGSSGPWKEHFTEMARKTVVRRLCKYLPMSVELEKAIVLSDEADAIKIDVIDVAQIENKDRVADLADRVKATAEAKKEA